MKEYNSINKIRLPNKKYDCIYADPPWMFNNKNTGGNMKSGSDNQYAVLSFDDICKLNVDSISKENCILFLWWVASQPKEAIEVCESWGFRIATMTGFSWIKQTKTRKDHYGMGFYTRQQQEHCLIGVKGKISELIINHGIRQNIREIVLEHSRKPIEAYIQINKLLGKNTDKIELFSRNRTRSEFYGFDCWGDEC